MVVYALAAMLLGNLGDFNRLADISNIAVVAQYIPTCLAYLPDGRLLVGQKGGQIYVVKNGIRESTPLWDANLEILDSDAEQVSYDLGDWEDVRRGQLAEALAGASIEHAWDEHGELVVLEDDEERVDAIVDAIEFPETVTVDDAEEEAAEEVLAADGLDPQDVLSELFVSSDRLMHDPVDHEGVLSLVDAARMAETLPLPYGFAPPVWNDLVSQARGLRTALEKDDVDDEQIVEQATRLRATLRNFV